jgi:hypothetical protein
MFEWIQNNETLAWWLGAGSLVMFVLTLIAVPVAVVRLPADYFVKPEHTRWLGPDISPALRGLWHVAKALLGIALIVLGILMLVLPGQGIITILIGVMLLQFPGKRRLQCWIVSRRSVQRSINWLRKKAGREPLRVE